MYKFSAFFDGKYFHAPLKLFAAINDTLKNPSNPVTGSENAWLISPNLHLTSQLSA